MFRIESRGAVPAAIAMGMYSWRARAVSTGMVNVLGALGTAWAGWSEALLIQGRDVLFDVDWQGARALRAAAPGDVVGIFILPPSIAELERRLHARAEDAPDVIQKRMARSLDEISHWEEYDYVLVNTLLEDTLAQIKQILAAERLKRQRQLWLKLHVERLEQGK